MRTRPVFTPESVARSKVVSLKMSPIELAALDRQRKLKGEDRSGYIRGLIEKDATRISRAKGTEKP
jgi:hypothetical protein